MSARWIVACDQPYYPFIDTFEDEGAASLAYAETCAEHPRDTVYLARVEGQS